MNPNEALAHARKLAKSGAVAEAANLYRQILERQPQNKRAKKELKELQKSAPASEQQQGLAYDLQSLVALYSNGETDRALAMAMHLKKIYPRQPLPLNIIGVIQNQHGNFEAAVDYCKKALALEPSYGDALNNLGSALHKLGRLDEAENCYLRLLSVQRDDPDALYNLANVLKEKGDLSVAASCYQKSLSLRPLYEPAHIALGQALVSLGEYPKALASFNKALELNPQSTDAHCGIGNLLHARNRSLEAISWYRDALKLDAKNLEAKFGMARALIATGKSEQAVPLLKEYLAARPSSTARHLLDAAKGHTTEIAPRQYIEATFNDYAQRFEEHLTQDLGYKAPAQLRELLDKHVDSKNLAANAIDLGCGTGLVAEAFQDCCTSIIGLDLSERMIEEAEKKGLYSELVLGDVVETLEEMDRQFDLFLSADTVIYIGNLEPLVQAVARRAGSGSLFLFSTELSEEKAYTLLSSLRYAHSSDYVKQTLEAADFELLAEEIHPLRTEKGRWLQGGFYVARYSGAEQ